jgi:hypothetical protein
MTRDTVTMTQLETKGCVAELYLNGVPVSRIGPEPGRIPIENVAVEQLIVPGPNTLELLVEPGESPGQARSGRRELEFRPMKAAARLMRYRDGGDTEPGHGEVLLEVEYRWSDASLERIEFPTSSSGVVDLGQAHGRWAFLDAAPLSLDEPLIHEASQLLDELEAALRTKNLGRLWSLSEPQLRDVLVAYPALSEAFLRADLEQMVAHYGKLSDPVLPRDPGAHDFRLVANGRLLQLVDADWSSSFKLRDPESGEAVGYPLFVGRVGSELRVVR